MNSNAMRPIRAIIIFMLAFNICTVAYSQGISREDFLSVIPALSKEDFKEAFEKTNDLLAKDKEDASELRPVIVYMNIYAGAGMVAKKELSREAFEKHVRRFEGQKVMLAIHPCIDSNTRASNSLQLSQKDGSWGGFITNTNKEGTSILSFDYIKFAEQIEPSEFIGKNVRCGGTLKSIIVAKGVLVICRLYIEDAFIKVTEPR